LPGVPSTRVFVLFRLRGVEGRSGESSTRSISFSGVAALTLSLLTILSASVTALSCGQPRGISLTVSLLLAPDFLRNSVRLANKD
jgi:hypothetical protein